MATPREEPSDPKKLLDEILNKHPSKTAELLDYALRKPERLERIEKVLPPQMKGQAERLVNRALMTFNRRPELRDCPPADFVRCVIEAAEMGLAIDGKLCYVVKFKANWVCMPDYKGLVAVSKRSGQIKDIYADVVHQNDHFVYRRVGGKEQFEHERNLGERGGPIAAYACIVRPDGTNHVEVMDIGELNKIQARAPAQNGPWKTDQPEMRKKTVIKRAMKLYCDDPAVVKAIELEDEIMTDTEPGDTTTALSGHQATLDKAAALRAKLRPGVAPTDRTRGTGTSQQPAPQSGGDSGSQDVRDRDVEDQGTQEPAEGEHAPVATDDRASGQVTPPVKELPWYESWRDSIVRAKSPDELDKVFEELEGLGGADTPEWKADFAETCTLLVERRIAVTFPSSDVNGYLARATARLAQVLNDAQTARLRKAAEDRAKDAPPKPKPKGKQQPLPGTGTEAYGN